MKYSSRDEYQRAEGWLPPQEQRLAEAALLAVIRDRDVGALSEKTQAAVVEAHNAMLRIWGQRPIQADGLPG